MRFYRVTIEDSDRDPVYFCTFDEGKKKLQAYHTDQFRRDKVFLDLIEIGVDQKSVCAILNHSDDAKGKLLKTWRLTNRGGLVEMPVEEEIK